MNNIQTIAHEAKTVICEDRELTDKNKVTMKKIKSSIKKRMLAYISAYNISENACCRQTGMSRGVLSQNNGISEENLMRFLDCYDDINLEWLFFGRGEMLIKSSTARKYKSYFPESLNLVIEDKVPYGGRQSDYYQLCSDVETLVEKINILEEDIKQLKEELKNKITH